MIGTKEILVIVFLLVVIISLFHFIRQRIERKNFRKYHSRKKLKDQEKADQ